MPTQIMDADPWTTLTEETEWTTSEALPNHTHLVYMSQRHANIVASMSIIISILGIIGNCLVFLAVSLSKKLHTPTNAFVINLGVADFVTAIVLPFQASGILSANGWPLAQWICKVVSALVLMTNGTSILTLTAIAVNRYILITFSRRFYDMVYTRRTTAAMLVSTWLCAFLFFVLLQLIPATGRLTYDPAFRTCLWDLQHPAVMTSNFLASGVLVVCCSIILFCYVRIYLFVRRHVKVTQTRLQMTSSNNHLDDTEDPLQSSASHSGPSTRQINITKNLAIIVIFFFICVLPYSLNLLIIQYSIVTVYLALLILLPTCTNPFIYAAKHPDFKVVFKCMLTCRVKDIPLPSDFLKSITRSWNTSSSGSNS